MHIIMIGGGQAAASTVQKFRALNQSAAVTIITDENHPPYQRPPLSKTYLAGEMELERLYLRPQEWYEENNIALKLSTTVKTLDRAAKTITLANGETLQYDKLVFATGSRPRRLPASITHNASNTYAVRNLADIDTMLPEFQKGRHLLVIGGGYIGLEAAAIARKFDVEVTLVETAPRILGRVASEATAEWIRMMHLEKGVKILEGTALEGFTLEGDKITHAKLSKGDPIKVDFIIEGIGILPNQEVAEAAGITCQDGILVDEHCQTNDPLIYAAGDCTRFEHQGALIRIESVGNAIDQGQIVGANLAGETATYQPKPWFWSDQYDTSLQIAGLNAGHEEVILRGDPKDQTLSIWYYKNDQLIAVDAINDARAYMVAKRLIEAGKNVPQADAANPETDLKSFLKS